MGISDSFSKKTMAKSDSFHKKSCVKFCFLSKKPWEILVLFFHENMGNSSSLLTKASDNNPACLPVYSNNYFIILVNTLDISLHRDNNVVILYFCRLTDGYNRLR